MSVDRRRCLAWTMAARLNTIDPPGLQHSEWYDSGFGAVSPRFGGGLGRRQRVGAAVGA